MEFNNNIYIEDNLIYEIYNLLSFNDMIIFSEFNNFVTNLLKLFSVYFSSNKYETSIIPLKVFFTILGISKDPADLTSPETTTSPLVANVSQATCDS